MEYLMCGRVILCCLILSLTSCSPSTNPDRAVTTGTATVSSDGDSNSLHSITIATAPKKSAPFDFRNAAITEDHLDLGVQYAGGCEDHSFDVYWDGLILEEDPVSVEIVVVHTDHDDECEAWVRNTITIDLSQIKAACKNVDSEEKQEIGITVTNSQG